MVLERTMTGYSLCTVTNENYLKVHNPRHFILYFSSQWLHYLSFFGHARSICKDYYHRYSIMNACSYYCYVMCDVSSSERVCCVSFWCVYELDSDSCILIHPGLQIVHAYPKSYFESYLSALAD